MTPVAPAALLTVSGLTLDLGRARLLDGVGLTVRPGEVVGLVGESGSGKTLTGLSILGLTPPGTRLGGSIDYDGTELVGTERAGTGPGARARIRGRQVSMIFQEPRSSLNPAWPVGRQITDVLRAHRDMTRRAARVAALEALGRVGLPDPRSCYSAYPYELSGGMCQRAMIAMALSCGPRLLIADEPTTALDVTVQAQIVALLRTIASEQGLSILLITHNLAIVTEICDRVVTMYCGQVVAAGPTRHVVTAPDHPYTWALMSAAGGRMAGGHEEAGLTGPPASPADPPAACRFHPRCPFAEARCTQTVPAMMPSGPGAETRCLRHAELSLPGVAA